MNNVPRYALVNINARTVILRSDDLSHIRSEKSILTANGEHGLLTYDLNNVNCPKWIAQPTTANVLTPNAMLEIEPLYDPAPSAPVPVKPPITASQFQEGDHLAFCTTSGRTLHLAVSYIDGQHAYLREPFTSVGNEYRVSLRSSELRHFDQMGWTLVEGKFDRHMPATKAIGG